MSYTHIKYNHETKDLYGSGDVDWFHFKSIPEALEEVQKHLESISDQMPNPTITRNCITWISGAITLIYRLRDANEHERQQKAEAIEDLKKQLDSLK